MSEANTKLKVLSPAQFAFLSWLEKTHPNLLRAAEDRRASLDGFMDSITKVFDTVTTRTPELLNTYVTGKAQLEQLKLNIARAKEGKPPVTDIAAPLRETVSSVPNWAWAAGGAIAVYLLLKLARR